MSSLLELFCVVDDFWQSFERQWRQQRLASGQQQRQRAGELSESEMMTIVIHFHQARYRDFKSYYTTPSMCKCFCVPNFPSWLCTLHPAFTDHP